MSVYSLGLAGQHIAECTIVSHTLLDQKYSCIQYNPGLAELPHNSTPPRTMPALTCLDKPDSCFNIKGLPESKTELRPQEYSTLFTSLIHDANAAASLQDLSHKKIIVSLLLSVVLSDYFKLSPVFRLQSVHLAVHANITTVLC